MVQFMGESDAQPVASGVRILGFDVLRALALAMMVAAHTTTFHGGTVLERIWGLPRWIDGAFVFVPVSGIVTGLVHRRVSDRLSVRASQLKLVRRAAFIYAVHVALTVVIVTVASLRHVSSFGEAPDWKAAGGVPVALLDIARFHLMLSFNDVLPMYVFFLVLAALFVVWLRSGRWRLVAVTSVALYAFSQTIDGLAVKAGSFHLAAWQLPFTVGLLVGWHWHDWRRAVPENQRRRCVQASAVAAVSLFVTARIMPATMMRIFGQSLDKMSGGWLAFVYAGAAITAAFALIERSSRNPAMAKLLRVFRILGAKGLPGFAAMVVAILTLDMLPSIPRTDSTILCVYAVCYATEFLALELERRRRGRALVASTDDLLVSDGPAGGGTDILTTARRRLVQGR